MLHGETDLVAFGAAARGGDVLKCLALLGRGGDVSRLTNDVCGIDWLSCLRFFSCTGDVLVPIALAGRCWYLTGLELTESSSAGERTLRTTTGSRGLPNGLLCDSVCLSVGYGIGCRLADGDEERSLGDGALEVLSGEGVRLPVGEDDLLLDGVGERTPVGEGDRLVDGGGECLPTGEGVRLLERVVLSGDDLFLVTDDANSH